MVNINKLKGKIVECELSVTELASRIGIDRATLYRKINSDGKNFTIEEADLISKSDILYHKLSYTSIISIIYRFASATAAAKK